jgi:hypothetical protein
MRWCFFFFLVLKREGRLWMWRGVFLLGCLLSPFNFVLSTSLTPRSIVLPAKQQLSFFNLPTPLPSLSPHAVCVCINMYECLVVQNKEQFYLLDLRAIYILYLGSSGTLCIGIEQIAFFFFSICYVGFCSISCQQKRNHQQHTRLSVFLSFCISAFLSLSAPICTLTM